MLAVKPGHFAEHMEIIRSQCHPISLRQLVDDLQRKKLTRRAVVVTFDDGYADNLYQAKPVLERYDIPATIYVTAGYIGSQREFWWDELDRLLLQPRSLPNRFSLMINDSVFTWEGSGETGQLSYSAEHLVDWNIEREDDPYPRCQLFRELFEQIHSSPDRERRRVLAETLAWTGAESSGRLTHRSMTTEELVALRQGGLIDIGAHTMVHSDLAALTPMEQQQEILQSKEYIETILHHPVTSFAYPYGSYTPETIAIVRDAGFESACATVADSVWPNAGRFQLPRLGVRDWDRQKFASWLSWWLDD